MGDNGPIQPDTEPSGAWPEHPDGRWDSGKYRLRAQPDQPPGKVPVRVPGSTLPYDQEAQEVADERQGIPSPVTEAWAAEAEQRLRVGKEGALAELERRNWAEQVQKLRKERDEWMERALNAEDQLEEQGL